MRVIVNAVVVGAVWKRKGKENKKRNGKEKKSYAWRASSLVPAANTGRY